MTGPWLNQREERAWRSLMKMQDGLSEYLERQLRTRSGLSQADYQVLAHLSEAPDGRLRSYELGALLHWEKSRLSQHLGRMQNRDLITRTRCLTDQRGAVVEITARGRDLIAAAAPQHVTDVRNALIDQLSPTELETLTAIGGKVLERLEALQRQASGEEPTSRTGDRSVADHARVPGPAPAAEHRPRR